MTQVGEAIHTLNERNADLYTRIDWPDTAHILIATYQIMTELSRPSRNRARPTIGYGNGSNDWVRRIYGRGLDRNLDIDYNVLTNTD